MEDPVTEYLVATRGDELVAGAYITDAHKLTWTKIEELTPELEDADELPPSIPESREVRVTSAIDLWFTDGHEDSLDAILETVRAPPDSGNRIAVPAHLDSRVSEAIDTDGFSKESHGAVRGLERPVEDAFIPTVRKLTAQP